MKTSSKTKEQIIQDIQLMEARLYLELKRLETKLGPEHEISTKLRHRWNTMQDLMATIGISPDETLPENKQASQII